MSAINWPTLAMVALGTLICQVARMVNESRRDKAARLDKDRRDERVQKWMQQEMEKRYRRR